MGNRPFWWRSPSKKQKAERNHGSVTREHALRHQRVKEATKRNRTCPKNKSFSNAFKHLLTATMRVLFRKPLAADWRPLPTITSYICS